MLNAIAYYRVSTTKQGQSGLGLEAQRASVESYAQAQRLKIVGEYQELETGTGKRQRPKLAAAIREAKEKHALLLIGKLDRLARSVAFISNLMETGVNFVAVNMPDANRLTVHIMAALAEHEARLISVRTRDALRASRARGKRLGTPTNLTDEGRRRSREKQHSEALEAYRQVAPYIVTLREAGQSMRSIAGILNSQGHVTRQGKQWSVSQVQNVLKKYTGSSEPTG